MPIDVRELLEQGAPAPLRDVDVDAVAARGRQWHRRRSATAATVVAAVVALAVLPLPRLLSSSPDVLFGPQPDDVVVGTWVSTDTEGGSRTMDIDAEAGGRYRVVANDNAGTVCSGVATTNPEPDRPDGAGPVLTVPLLDCETAPLYIDVDGVRLEEARDYILIYEADTATLGDSLGYEWHRPSAAPDPVATEAAAEVEPANVLWPQSSLKEARAAQERADAGDPDYAWQVNRTLDRALDDGPGRFDGEIFTRFLSEELGWDEFRSGEDPWIWGTEDNGVFKQDFIRCGEGASNTMYPDDPDGRACPPSLGERGYETVRLGVYQPVDDGPDGIWVIASSEPQEPFRQVKPIPGADIAAVVEAYAEARFNGAPWYSDGYNEDEVPLLDATSDGSPYERFDYEVVEGPTWPFGIVYVNLRLFADGGQTVVEQPFTLKRSSEGATPELPYAFAYASGDTGTTDNGEPVPDPYNDLFKGRVDFAADPRRWEFHSGPHGPDVTNLQRTNERDHMFTVVGDPLTPTGTCDVGDLPRSADALVRNIRSIPNLSVSEPRPTRVGSLDALQLDITAVEEFEGCVAPPGAPQQPPKGLPLLAPRADSNHLGDRQWWRVQPGQHARLYALDAPGTPRHAVAILVMAPKADFPAVMDAAQPILDSFD